MRGASTILRGFRDGQTCGRAQSRLEEGDKSPYTQRHFEDGGSGGFETAYAFVTQPLACAPPAETTMAPEQMMATRSYFGELSRMVGCWHESRVGPPRSLLTTGRTTRAAPSLDDMRRPPRRGVWWPTRGLFGGAGIRGNRVSPWSHDFVGFAVVGCRRRAVGSVRHRTMRRAVGAFTLVYRSSLKSRRRH